ncbi:hypothetical protein KUTeg_004774 [Tegillarca granosa]|uniref:Uncharacterized protein n=1 Tax=Tegillarca granosa TaxID=220873 RepID=A0ABQ9FKS7_TEGGR|nr:hypothetical protein KUTeg_004774 [Tegillarca granosa]
MKKVQLNLEKNLYKEMSYTLEEIGENLYIASLKEALNFTKQENIRLQGNKMREQLAKLPPLKVPKKPVGIQSSTGMVKLGDLPETVPGKSDLTSLSKETVQLFNFFQLLSGKGFDRYMYMYMYKTSAVVNIIIEIVEYFLNKWEVNKLCSCPRIVDISKRKPGTEPITESIKPGRELVERTAKLTLLEKKTQDLQVLHEKSAESVLVGKIRVPVKDGSEGEIIPINIVPHTQAANYSGRDYCVSVNLPIFDNLNH